MRSAAAEADTGQAECVVEEIEGDQRHQAYESDESPVLPLDALDDLGTPPADALPHPAEAEMPGGEESKGRTEGGAGQVVEGPRHRPEQRAAGERQHRAGHEADRRESVKPYESERREDARAVHGAEKPREIELAAMQVCECEGGAHQDEESRLRGDLRATPPRHDCARHDCARHDCVPQERRLSAYSVILPMKGMSSMPGNQVQSLPCRKVLMPIAIPSWPERGCGR